MDDHWQMAFACVHPHFLLVICNLSKLLRKGKAIQSRIQREKRVHIEHIIILEEVRATTKTHRIFLFPLIVGLLGSFYFYVGVCRKQCHCRLLSIGRERERDCLYAPFYFPWLTATPKNIIIAGEATKTKRKAIYVLGFG